MEIRNVVHRGLRRVIERDDPSSLPPAVVERVRNIGTFLQEMAEVREVRDVPSQLTGDCKGTWSLMITRNWRITFKIDQVEREIVDLKSFGYKLSQRATILQNSSSEGVEGVASTLWHPFRGAFSRASS